MSEPEVLEHVRDTLCPQESLTRFIAAGAADPELARRRTEILRRTATPLA